MVVHFPLKALTLALSAAVFLTACDNSDEVQTQAPTEREANEAVVEAVEHDSASQARAQARVDSAAVAKHYADLAHATYQDAATTAEALNEAVDALISEPTEAHLAAAKQAWLDTRVAYQQSEVFRFGNAVVDDWEGQLNAWPLDEGMIDYVAADGYQHEMGNDGATANIIANAAINIGGETLDVSDLTPELLADLNEAGGSEANVATGYHAIEFLLWGQDLNGYAAGSGERPVTDYASNDACTNDNCDRRAEYLDAVTDLLVTDLQWMTEQWAEDQSGNYRAELLAMPSEDVMQKMLFGMGSLSLGELAGERMKVALEANSYEDEHDCFSDNTHNSHFYNAKGIQNVYLGEYQPAGGTAMTGPSLSALVAQGNPELDQQLRAELESTMTAVQAMKDTAEAEGNAMAFDMMIAPDNQQGHEIINAAITALVVQTGSIEKVAGELGLASLEPEDAGHAF